MARIALTPDRLKHIIKEELAQAPVAGAGIGKLLSDLVGTFEAKLSQQYPGDVVKREAADLKTQIEALLRAAVTKVKTAQGKAS